MVTEDKNLLTIEASDDGSCIFWLPKEHVTDNVDRVIGTHSLIPAPDHLFVHLLIRGEGTVAVSPDVFVVDVKVRCEPVQLHSEDLSDPFTLSDVELSHLCLLLRSDVLRDLPSDVIFHSLEE